jgi:hypothetical protein
VILQTVCATETLPCVDILLRDMALAGDVPAAVTASVPLSPAVLFADGLAASPARPPSRSSDDEEEDDEEDEDDEDDEDDGDEDDGDEDDEDVDDEDDDDEDDDDDDEEDSDDDAGGNDEDAPPGRRR